MKKLLLLIIVITLSFQSILAQDTPPAKSDASKAQHDTKQKTAADPAKGSTGKNDTPKPRLVIFDTFQVIVKRGDTTKIKFDTSKNTAALNDCNCTPHYNNDLGGGWILVFAPVIIFFIIFFSIGIVKDFEISKALAENEQSKRTILNTQYSIENIQALKDNVNVQALLPPTIEVSDPQPPDAPVFRASISRYIAFITSMVTITLAVCISCFYIYQYMYTSCPPDLSALTPVLIALGIGIMPYAFNKVAAAVGKDS